jgi:hypothetical protein
LCAFSLARSGFADRTEQVTSVRGKLVKDLKIEAVLGRTGEELLVSVWVAKLEGELLVIAVTRATSLGRPTPFESAAAGGSSALLSGAEPIGR